jgi:transcription initiation factor TFIID TATA-box-binding protein
LKEAKAHVVNVVATADLKQPVNLMLASRLEGAIYSPDKYQGRVVYFKLRGMQGKVTVFSTGKMISVGTTSVKQAKRELQRVANLLATAGLIRRVRVETLVRNIVTSIDLGRPLNLEALYLSMPRFIYEPDQFPAAIWRPASEPGSTVLVFSSGKLVITGKVDMDTVSKIEMEILKESESMLES